MGILERKLRQKEEVRTRILETAFHLVKQEGWHALSLRKIAEAIEYSVPVIYDHFENKEAILEEFGVRGFGLLVKKLEAAKAKHTDPELQLKAIADAYWNFAFRNPEYYQVMFSMGMQGCAISRCTRQATFYDILMEPLIALLKKYDNASDPCFKYHTFWSILHGLVSIKMVAPPSPETTMLNKMVLDDAIEGFLKNLKS